MINKNMRCIEIACRVGVAWANGKINKNMRCIEIMGDYKGVTRCNSINKNMRCIEMRTQDRDNDV